MGALHSDSVAFSVPLLILYVLSLLLYGAVYKANVKASLLLPPGRGQAPGSTLLAAGTHVAAVWALRALCQHRHVAPRLMMVVVPLVIIGEFYFRNAKRYPENARLHWGGLAGSAAGAAAGMLLFLKDAPIK